MIGTRGSTVVTGAQLRARLGLRDTWFYVRRVSRRAEHRRRGSHAARRAPARRLRQGRPAQPRLRDAPAPQRRSWRTSAAARCVDGGAYRFHVGTPGVYRVMAGWAPGPVRVAATADR